MRCLLLLDPAGRVLAVDSDSGARFDFENLPTAGDGGGTGSARTAAWSASGQWTAWSLGSADFDGVQEIRGHHEGSDTNVVISAALTAFYLYPSPCGRYLSHLSPGPLGLELAVSDLHGGELRVIERGQPLFWSWSPDSSQIAVHVEDRVLVVPVGGGTARLVSQDAGAFVVPWWMPDGSVVFVSDDQIVSYGPDGAVTPLPVRPGAGRFALDGDGRRIALMDVVDGVASLVVVDLLTAQRSVVTGERTAAFFWSPDGRRLAALVVARPGHLQWVVSDGSSLLRLEPFRPSPSWLREVLPFFEQYSHSHSHWSADSTRLVAPAVDADGSSEALVQTVDEPVVSVRLPGARLAWWAD